jgi:phosphonate transport system ATP-binding protein
VAIARALAQESRVLLADEPVASLDPDTAVSVLRLMQALTRSNGLAILCTLHQPELAERFADRILRMRDGRLEEETSRALVTARREAG